MDEVKYTLLNDELSFFKDRRGNRIIHGRKGDVVTIKAFFEQIAIVKSESGNTFSTNKNNLLLWIPLPSKKRV